VTEQPPSGDPEAQLRGAASLRALLEAVEELQVRRARELGCSWEQIRAELGTSKHALHQYVRRERSTRTRLRTGLPRLPRRSRDQTIKLAQRYIEAGAEEAARLGHGYVGSEHVLLALTRDRDRDAARILRQLGVTHADIRRSALLAQVWAPRIDPHALERLGIDLNVVRERLEKTFGPDALDRVGTLRPTHVKTDCIASRLKQGLARAIEHAGSHPIQDEHVLLGILDVPDSLAARALAELGVSLEAVQATLSDPT